MLKNIRTVSSRISSEKPFFLKERVSSNFPVNRFLLPELGDIS